MEKESAHIKQEYRCKGVLYVSIFGYDILIYSEFVKNWPKRAQTWQWHGPKYLTVHGQKVDT